MSERQKMTDAELDAILCRIWGPKLRKQRPKPKVIMNDGEVVRDAIVKVGPDDPNYAKSNEGVVQVRRSDWVTINMEVYEEQQRQKMQDRIHRRVIDPARMGHWSGGEDE
jgi:hypothetical protein